MKPDRFHLALSAAHVLASLAFACAGLTPWVALTLVLSAAHAVRGRSLRPS